MSRTGTTSEHDLAEYPDAVQDEEMTEVASAVVEIAEHYLGFAAREYLDRQCRLHLDKPLNELQLSDVEELARWVNNTAPLIMDREESKELVDEISALA